MSFDIIPLWHLMVKAVYVDGPLETNTTRCEMQGVGERTGRICTKLVKLTGMGRPWRLTASRRSWAMSSWCRRACEYRLLPSCIITVSDLSNGNGKLNPQLMNLDCERTRNGSYEVLLSNVCYDWYEVILQAKKQGKAETIATYKGPTPKITTRGKLTLMAPPDALKEEETTLILFALLYFDFKNLRLADEVSSVL